jgi:hypothetical protein
MKSEGRKTPGVCRLGQTLTPRPIIDLAAVARGFPSQTWGGRLKLRERSGSPKLAAASSENMGAAGARRRRPIDARHRPGFPGPSSRARYHLRGSRRDRRPCRWLHCKSAQQPSPERHGDESDGVDRWRARDLLRSNLVVRRRPRSTGEAPEVGHFPFAFSPSSTSRQALSNIAAAKPSR